MASRAMVVMRSVYGHRTRKGALSFDNFDNFAALILTAMRTRAVGADFLVTVRAFSHLRHTQSIVGSPCGRAPLRMATFGIRHGSSSSFLILLYASAAAPAVSLVRRNLCAQRSEFAPAIIAWCSLAPAIVLVPVLPAGRADAFTLFAADKLHRHG